MMKYETFKVGETTFNIAKGSCQFTGQSGTVAIVVGTNSIDTIHNVLSRGTKFEKFDESGNFEWSRTDLVYSGKLSRIPNYPIGIDEVSPGVNVEVLDSVVIVEYKKPDVNDSIIKLSDDVVTVQDALTELFFTILPTILSH